MIKHSFIILLLISLFFEVKSQQIKAGVHFGYGMSRFKLDDNQLNDFTFASQGRLFSAGLFGIQATLEESRDQPSKFLTFTKALLAEASLCRCGGNVQLTSTFPNGSVVFNELNYVVYQGDYSVKAMVGIRDFKLLAGPVVSNSFFSGVKTATSDDYKSAANQISSFFVGYEIGFALRHQSIMLSGRMRRNITDFGLESELIPTEFRNPQTRIVLSYFFFYKGKEKNFRSIFWK